MSDVKKIAKEMAMLGRGVTQEQFDALPGRLGKVVGTTEKSDFHHIKDSAAFGVLEFGMEGKTEQNTVPGNQLFDKNSTAIINELLQNDGTAFPNLYYVHTDFIEVSPTETYALKIFNSAYLFSGLWMYDENKTFVSKYGYATNIVISENVKYIMIACTKSVYEVFSESDMNNVADSLMLIKGSAEPTTYEPFTNGASPNPTHPQDIKLAGVLNEATGRYEIGCKVGNKNLWDKEYASDVNNWLNSGNLDYIPIPIPKGAKATVSYKQSLNTGLGFYSYASVKETGQSESEKLYLYHNGSTVYIKKTVSIVAEKNHIYIHCSGIKSNIDKFMQYIGNDLQIEIADTQTDYTPHASQPLTLTSPVPLTKWDYLTKRDGVWGWSVNSRIHAFTGDEGYGLGGDVYYTGESTACIIYLPNKKNVNNDGIQYDYIDRLSFVPGIWGKTDGSVGYYSINNYTIMRFRNADMEITDNMSRDEKITCFKSYLKSLYENENPVIIAYETDAEQSFHPLPEEEQELLKNLETYYGVTNLYNDQGCPMWVKYVQDTKLYVDQKFLEIQQAMI